MKQEVPYFTARLSLTQFIYSFPSSPGQKFIRLYFYPTSYPGSQNYTPFFTVKAGRGNRLTLLNNFTVGDHSDTIIKEFCVDMRGDESLNITFIPGPNMANAYALINGIEIVSMPANLYYSASYSQRPQLVGHQGSLYDVNNDTALELMYRVNVGGRGIAPQNDTGMYRNWDNDYPYLSVSFPTAMPVYSDGKISFTAVPNYTAPGVLYRTARSMGPNRTTNMNNNLTWIFPVDPGFTYLVRLHFCELVPSINRRGERTFKIFLDSQLAEGYADVIRWTGDQGIPVYRDYAVLMGNVEGAKETAKRNLSIQLHPAEEWSTVYEDAILNGVEIFKSSNGGDLTSGSSLDLPSSTGPFFSAPPPPMLRKNSRAATKDAIIGGVVSGALVLSFLVYFIIRFRNLKTKEMTTTWGKSSNSKDRQNSPPRSGPCQYFSLPEIKVATNNFDHVLIIGAGGFGDVYKGFINDGATPVAIKRLKQGSEQGAQEFKMEIEMLSQLRHLHLVFLIGYCDEDNEMILVYDYMSRGTLRDHLYNTNNPPLSWARRLEICIGAARGLQYLHSGVKRMIIHRDVKTTNILLDEKWVAKVSDFGLSKIGPNSSSITHVSTMVKGSVGYLDPEYYYLQHLTEKSDVYSFGVVLCEVLCARPPINRLMVDRPVSLVILFRNSYQGGSLGEIIDPCLIGNIGPECLKKYAEVTFSCISESGVDRPSMSDVVWGLEFALQLQESAKEQVMQMKAGNGDNGQEEQEIRQTEVELVATEIPLKARLIYG